MVELFYNILKKVGNKEYLIFFVFLFIQQAIFGQNINKTGQAVTFDGKNYPVVWENNRGGCSEVYGVCPQGVVISTMDFRHLKF